MPLNYSVVKNSIYTWANSIVTPIPVIFYQPNAPRPELPYITLYLSSIVQIGDDYIPKPDILGVSGIVGDRDFTIQIQAFGGDPLTILETLRSSLQKPSVLDTLRINNVVFVNHNPITDVSQLLDTLWEPRASMDVQFRIAQIDDDNLGGIDTVELTEIFNNAETEVYNETVTITSL